MTKIRLIKKNTDLSKCAHLMNWDIWAHGKPLDIYRVDGYVHTIGGRFLENDYWCCERGKKLTYESAYEFNGDIDIFGFSIKPINYYKYKYDESSIEHNYHVTITRNDKIFYEFACRDLAYGVSKAQCLITEIEDMPLNFFEKDYQKKIIGRKIYWREIPAIITNYFDGSCCIMIKPDNGEKYFKNPIYFENEDEPIINDNIDGEVKLDILMDHSIWWFRE